MLKKTLKQDDIALHVLKTFAADPEVQRDIAASSLTVVIEMLAVPRNGANWQCVYAKPITFDEAARRATATVQAEYDLERPFPGGTAARL